MEILIIGSTNTDMVVKAHHLPKPGETIIGGKFLMNPGGKGANQAVAAVRLGGIVRFIGKTGNDLFGKQSVSLLNQEGIQTDAMLKDPTQPSGVALITVDTHAENCIVVAPGANMTINKEELDKHRAIIENSDIILMQLEIPLEIVEYVADIAFAKKRMVILNPAPACELPDSLLMKLSIITPNETEAEMISGIPIKDSESIELAAKTIREKGVENVIITLGSKGAYVSGPSRSEFIAAPQVKAVDTTAAGDTFNGAMAVALSEGKELKAAVEFANKAASIAVTRMGAQASVPYRKEIY